MLSRWASRTIACPATSWTPATGDSGIEVDNHPVYGMYQPDAIAVYEQDGKTYLVTANEGDARDYDGFSEEERIDDLTLDPTAFPDAATLQQNDVLGRLQATNTLGDTDGDGDFDELYVYGGRSFSIFEVTGLDTPGSASLTQVFDSGADFENLTAQILPDDFNSDNDENGSFDSRSDAKGPEPEGLTLGQIGDRVYAFIGLERVGGVMVYDITDPLNPVFVEYGTTRDFTVDALVEVGDPAVEVSNPAAGDLGPEGLLFIPASDSPTNRELLVVANEVSGTTRIYSVVPTPTALFAGLGGLGLLALRRRTRAA